MKKLAAICLGGFLMALAACSGSSTSPTPGQSPTVTQAPSSGASQGASGTLFPILHGPSLKIVVPPVRLLSLVPGSATPGGGSARDNFLGTWTGHYGCPGGSPVADKLVVKAGSGAGDLLITIHADASNPDNVNGTVVSNSEADVPQQSMGGMSATARLILHGDTLPGHFILEFQESAAGFTCGGTDYQLAS